MTTKKYSLPNTKGRPSCAECGQRYGRRDVVRGPNLKWKAGEAMPPYRGNELLASSHTVVNDPELSKEAHGWHETWDGETWVKPYEPFCTLRCALSYARKAYARHKPSHLKRVV